MLNLRKSKFERGGRYPGQSSLYWIAWLSGLMRNNEPKTMMSRSHYLLPYSVMKCAPSTLTMMKNIEASAPVLTDHGCVHVAFNYFSLFQKGRHHTCRLAFILHRTGWSAIRDGELSDFRLLTHACPSGGAGELVETSPTDLLIYAFCWNRKSRIMPIILKISILR